MRDRPEQITIAYQGRSITLSARTRMSGQHLVLFLHGLGCAKESFDLAFYALADQSLSLCTFDFPGHGGSSRADPEMYDLKSYADVAVLLVRELRRHRNIGQVSLIGHSMGGSVGLLAAPGIDDLAGYVSIEGNLVSEDCGLVSRQTAAQSLEEFRAEGHSLFLKQLRTSGDRGLLAWSDWYERADPIAVHTSARSLVEWSESGSLLKHFVDLPIEKRYLYGDAEDKRYLLNQFDPNLGLCLPHAGHFMMVETPDNFYAMIAGFLSLQRVAAPLTFERQPVGGMGWASRRSRPTLLTSR